MINNIIECYVSMNKKEKGFALINFAILLLAGGLLLVGNNLTLKPIHNSIAKEKETMRKMKAIKERLELFLIKNKRLPCPAILSIKPGETHSNFSQSYKFGEEVYDANVDKCIRPPGYFHIFENSELHHFRGAAPVTSLGLPESAMFDGWNNKIEYIVTAELTTSFFADVVNKDIIEVKIDDSKSEQAALLLISHNSDEFGSYNLDGKEIIPFDTANSFDIENLNNDTVFDKRANDTILNFSSADLKEVINSYCPNCYPEPGLDSTNSICNIRVPECRQFGRAETWTNAVLSNEFPVIIMQTGENFPYFDLTGYSFVLNKSYKVKFKLDSMNVQNSLLTLYYYYLRNNSIYKTKLADFSSTLLADYNNNSIGSMLEINWTPYTNNEVPIKLQFEWNNNETVLLQAGRIGIHPVNESYVGRLKYHIWENVNKGKFENLINQNLFPNYPNVVTDTVTGTRRKTPPHPSYGIRNYSNSYGSKIFGYFTPQSDGAYNFRVKADDVATLWLTPATTITHFGIDDGNKIKLLTTSNKNSWYEAQCMMLNNTNNGETASCQGENFLLKGGESYYFEILHTEDKSSDYVEFDIRYENGSYTPFNSETLSTIPKCLVGKTARCSTYYETSATLSPYSFFQQGDVIPLNDIKARFIRIDILDTYGDATYSGLNEIRVRKTTGELIDFTKIKILEHHESLYSSNDYADYNPYNLLNSTSINDDNVNSFSFTAQSNQKNVSWMFDTSKYPPYYVLLDLGDVYSVQDIIIWNLNEQGNSNSPAKNIKILASSNPLFLTASY